MHVNTIFKKDSAELNAYRAKNPIGGTLIASDGSKVWTIKDVILRTDLPPDSFLGNVVMIQLVLESPDERSPVPPPPV
jgi:hypothetical protein